jgi:hypothetical protein
MRQEHEPYDLDTSPELLRLAEEVRASGKPRALRRGGEVLAVLMPFTGRRLGRLKKRTLSAQDIADFRKAAGTWSGVNLDEFLGGVYAAREEPEDRPSVDL